MKIQTINATDKFFVITEAKKNDIQEVKTKKSITAFPKGYGSTNIAFCSRAKGNNIRNTNAEKSNLLSWRQVFEKPDLPYFSPYKIPIERALNFIGIGQSCLLFYNDGMDSKELFLNNLRKNLNELKTKTGSLRTLGNLPIIKINMADFVENSSLDSLRETIIRNTGNNKKAVIVADEADALFDTLKRPDSFFKSSLFKMFPTIFLMEERYMSVTPQEDAMYNSRFENNNSKSKDILDNNYSIEEVQKQTSRHELLSQNRVGLPVIKYKNAVGYLLNPYVQKHLLSQNANMSYSPDAIVCALNLANADLYLRLNHYGTNCRRYIIEQNATAFDNAIKLLKLATIDAASKSSKTVNLQNIKNIYPNNVDFVLYEMERIRKLYQEEKRKAFDTIRNQITQIKTENTKTDNKNEEEEIIPENTNFSIIRNSKSKFSDIGGMFNVKKQLKEEFLDILKNKDIKNSQKPNGILLYGPPGCGKTLLAKAIAGEAGVPFISTAGSSFVEIYVGTGAKRVRELYNIAKEEAKNHPSKTAIVFIDEVDAAAGERKNKVTSEDSRTVDALLHEMDGTKNKGENDVKIITVIATNNMDMLDSAITRNGRIDIKCYIDDPRFSEKARREILDIHAKNLPFENDKEKENIIANLAQSSSGMSGADLAEVIKKAYRLSLSTNRKNVITQNDINEAKMRVQAGIKTDIEANEYEKRQTIAREAGHAVNSMILEKIFEGEEYKHKMPSKVLDFISNSARGGSLGSTYFKPSSFNKTASKESCLADVIMLYGSYAVETQMFDTHTSNVEKDMENAAGIIEKAVIDYDFGSSKRFVSLKSQNMRYLYSEEIKRDVEDFAKKGMKISEQIIKFAKPFISEYINSLLSKQSNREVTAEEFKQQFDKWLKSSNKQEEYAKLCKDIKTQITEFCKEKESEKLKMGF